MALQEKTFGLIKKEGDSFWVDNKNGDKVKFEDCGFENQEDFFIKNMDTAFEQACAATLKKGENDSLSCSLDSILEVYEDLRTQASEMAERRSSCKGELADFINTLMNNLGKNALATMFQRLDSKPSVSVFEEDGDYKFYIEVNGKPIDVNTTRSWYNLLLLDGTSVEQLLVPEATVLVRLKPAAEEELVAALGVCCDMLEGFINDAVLDKAAIVEKLESLIEEKEKKDDSVSDSASAILRERRKFKKDSEEYKKLTSDFFGTYNEGKKIRQASATLSALKKVIKDLYVPNASLSAVLLKGKILNSILNSFVMWSFDVPGFVSRDDVKFLTTGDDYMIGRNQTLNKARLGSDSFYVRAADLRPFSEVVEVI